MSVNRIHHQVLRALATPGPLQRVGAESLRAVAEPLGWAGGVLWTLDEPMPGLRAAAWWLRDPAPTTVFERTISTMRLAVDSSVVGHVLMSRSTVWLDDLSADPACQRAAAATAAGFKGALLVPVV